METYSYVAPRSNIKCTGAPTAEEIASWKQRIYDGSVPITETGCWIWIGSISFTKHNDVRPITTVRGAKTYVYRLSYKLFVDDALSDGFICHRCSVSLCVNPAHLYKGDAKTNSADAWAAGRAPQQRYPEFARQQGMRLSEFRRASGGYLSKKARAALASKEQGK